MERRSQRHLLSAAIVLALLAAAGPDTAASARDNPGFTGTMPPAVQPHRLALPALLPDSTESTSVVVQNAGSLPSTIALDTYTPAGVLIPSASESRENVPPGGSRTFFQAANAGLAPGFHGVAVLGSDQPVNALLAREMDDNATGRKSYSLHSSHATGGATVTLPYVANNVNGIYQTRFAIANAGTTQACVVIQYSYAGGGGMVDRGPAGTGCAGGGYAVPVGGQVAFGPLAVALDATQAMPAPTAGKIMAVTVTATGAAVNVAIDAYLTNGTRKLGSYDGFIYANPTATNDDLGASIAIPLAAKTADGYYTQILMSNPNSVAANATITYKSGTGQSHVVTRSIPAQGTASHSAYEEATPPIPLGFVGSATIVSTQPIAAVLFRAKMTTAGSGVDEELYTAVNGVPLDRGSTVARLPLVVRRANGNNASCDASGASCGMNSWVSVQVVDGSSANVTLSTIPDPTAAAPGCASAVPSTVKQLVAGSTVFYQNANTGNGLDGTPACVLGGMVVTADKPIIVVANVTSDLAVGDIDGMYNAFTN